MRAPFPVDLREGLLPVRDQGETRPTCLAFAATAAHEYARNRTHPLCVEFLYFDAARTMPNDSSSSGLTMRAVDLALRERGEPLEEIWPYDPDGPNPAHPPLAIGKLYRCVMIVHDHCDVILPAIRRGTPVVLGVGITNTWYANLAPHYVIGNSTTSSVGHAVLVAGAGQDPNGNTLVLIQNSWGKRWADHGFAWLTWEYVQAHFMGCMTVEELV